MSGHIDDKRPPLWIGCREKGRGPRPDRDRAAQIRIAIKGISIVIKGTFYPD
jgi:hypothetical protein